MSLTNHLRLLEQPLLGTLFIRSYFRYKRHIEDPFHGLVREHGELFAKGHVLDIGANIGYTSTVFAQAIIEPYKVHAFEPELKNMGLMERALELYQRRHMVVCKQVAVGSISGELTMWYNPNHHADHRVSTGAFAVDADPHGRFFSVPEVSIDDYCESQGIENEVAFIKMDVQGYELEVCRGMTRTIERNPREAVAVEYCPAAMEELGVDPKDLVEFFCSRDYDFYRLERGKDFEPIAPESLAEALGDKGYLDFVAIKRHQG